MAEQIYRYKAFISYRHVDPDRRWAKWLIEHLETFRTPRALVAHGVPSQIGHLFRDDEEIPASSNLSNQIEEALKASQYLIVVCSPNTPQSQWCRHEIAYFRQLGKGDRILALLIEGEPDESFPPELLHVPYEVTHPDGSKTTQMRDEEPIASDVRPRADEPKHTTERRALIRIAATLLGVAFDDLAQRDHQRALRRQRLIGSAIAAAVLVVAVLGGWWWDYTRLKTAYYADIGTHWAEPFGIGGLSRSDAARRWVSYEVQSQRGHVVRVRRVNGSGGLKPLKGDEMDSEPWNGNAAEWRVRYQGDRVGTIEVYGPTGQLLRTEAYRFFPDGQSGLVTFTRSTGIAKALSSNVTSFQTRTSAGSIDRNPDVTQHRLAFAPQGLIARRSFETVWGTPAKDENGNAGRSYVYAPDGQPVSERALGSSGQVIVSKTGAAEERRAYDASGSLTRFEMRDPRGALLSAVDIRYDDRGDPVDKLWTGPDGKPVLNAEDLIAEERDTHDDRGNLTRGSFFDEAGHPMANKHGYAQFTSVYDALGRAVRTSYFNAKGRPTLDNRSVAGATTELDAAGNVVALHMLGIDGKPTICTDGYATMRTRYDAAGYAVERLFYDKAGKLMLDHDGLAIVRSITDPRGNLVDQRYFDTLDRPVNSDGYARLVSTYDDRGNQTSQFTYDAAGKPAISTISHVAGIRYAYNEQGYWTQLDFFGADGGPMLKDGSARLTFAYDDHGNPTQETVFGTNYERVNNAAGYSRLVQDYDGDDNVIAQHFFDTADKPAITAFGYANLRTRYDGHGNDVETTFLDTAGNPLASNQGYARSVKVFDSSRRVTEERYYDAQGNLLNDPRHFAVIRRVYDRRGNIVDVATYDANLKLVKIAAFARMRTKYDFAGHAVETAFFDAQNKLIVAGGFAMMRSTYDDVGNIVDLAYYGADAKPVDVAGPRFSFARAHAIIGRDGIPLGATYYDAAGRSHTEWDAPHRNK